MGNDKVRAGFSCLPVVGPVVSLYNACEVKAELSESPLQGQLRQLRYSLTGARGGLAAMAGNREGAIQVDQEVDEHRDELRRKCLVPSEKGRAYSKYGIIGNVLTVALVVALIAFGVFTGPLTTPLILIGCFTFQALVHSYNFYQHTKNIDRLQADLNAQPAAT